MSHNTQKRRIPTRTRTPSGEPKMFFMLFSFIAFGFFMFILSVLQDL